MCKDDLQALCPHSPPRPINLNVLEALPQNPNMFPYLHNHSNQLSPVYYYLPCESQQSRAKWPLLPLVPLSSILSSVFEMTFLKYEPPAVTQRINPNSIPRFPSFPPILHHLPPFPPHIILQPLGFLRSSNSLSSLPFRSLDLLVTLRGARFSYDQLQYLFWTWHILST